MKPLRTSTPKTAPLVRGRPSIHDRHKETLSPVQLESPKKDMKGKRSCDGQANVNVREEKTNENSEETNEDGEMTDEGSVETNGCDDVSERVINEKFDLNRDKIKNVNNQHNRISYYCAKYKNYISKFCLIFILLIVIMFPSNYITENVERKDNVDISLNRIKANYPNQDVDFWRYIASNIREVRLFNKPLVILFLYLESHESKSNELITQISLFASKALNKNVDTQPIIINGYELNTKHYLKDYGILIDDYRHELAARRVMVVKNLDVVAASVSQAFHVICDEYAPFVGESVVIFGIGVFKFTGKEMEQAGSILRDRWKDLEADKLEALVARVTSLVLKISPEL